MDHSKKKKDETKMLLDIPKKHALKHYMRLLGRLYSEKEEFLETYIDEQVIANQDNLDGAIKCFRETLDILAPKNYVDQQENNSRVEHWLKPKK